MALLLQTTRKELGGFSVKRIIPNQACSFIGPFVFIDHMGPANFAAGEGISVRPHPHIGLATISYLMEGSMLHQDSLGSYQEILPGDVNWMVAGHGIVHSERETIEVKATKHRLNGLQCWIALPEDKTEIEPSFQHIPKAKLPYVFKDKLMMRIIAGEAYGKTAPVATHSPLFYVDVIAEQGNVLNRPHSDYDTAIYIQRGSVTIGSTTYEAGDFVLLEHEQTFTAERNCRYFIMGGKALEKAPILRWNFLAYDEATLQQAEKRWQEGRFPEIPNDNHEFIPYPAFKTSKV